MAEVDDSDFLVRDHSAEDLRGRRGSDVGLTTRWRHLTLAISRIFKESVKSRFHCHALRLAILFLVAEGTISMATVPHTQISVVLVYKSYFERCLSCLSQ